jgi:hypothetical protein
LIVALFVVLGLVIIEVLGRGAPPPDVEAPAKDSVEAGSSSGASAAKKAATKSSS